MTQPINPYPSEKPTTGSATRVRRSPVLALAVLLALIGSFVIGCGDDDDDITTDTTPGADVTPGTDTTPDTTPDTTDDATGAAEDAQQDLAQVLRDNGLDSLASAVETVEIQSLVGDSEFTLFAPSDQAFLGLGADETADLLTDPGRLADVLRHHVVDERLTSTELSTMSNVETTEGSNLDIGSDAGTITVNGASVTTADIDAGPGVIHIIDRVLVP